jgi:predicted hydrocarbon binding protein
MSEEFERAWQGKFGRSIEKHATDEVRDKVLERGEHLSDRSPREVIIAWSDCAITELERLVPLEKAQDILTECACHYPREDLKTLREAYMQRGDNDEIHAMLLAIFRDFLDETLGLDDGDIDTILERGWGLAGLRHGNNILVTKIPKSGYLKAYLQEKDPQRRREMYCHCTRVREAVKLGTPMPKTYCYCGAGFYKDVWETILGEPVQVEVRSSVLQGDDVCTIAIRLPV